MTIKGLGTATNTALIISECQNGMTDPAHSTNDLLSGQVAKRNVIGNIDTLAAGLRRLGVPIFHVTFQGLTGFRGWAANSPLTASIRKRPLVEGHVSVRINPGITVDPDDIIVARHRGLTAFHGTELEYLLRNMGVQSVVVTGVSLNVALPGSVIEAVNRGFSVVVPRDCVSGATDETHDFVLTHMLPVLSTVTTSQQILTEFAMGDAAKS
ncbi:MULTISPECIES: cysteine hydrolase family protein [Nocardia]|uniref:cysteine hydrolase family protein n=1 Tax=Nocardia abscessus TaxID=120957 RepID=UPI0018935859|nr:cysteine hydrolase [Nocardia abscessus]MBF6472420.1 cysteine hydrolase [Nocardia abscessus]